MKTLQSITNNVLQEYSLQKLGISAVEGVILDYLIKHKKASTTKLYTLFGPGVGDIQNFSKNIMNLQIRKFIRKTPYEKGFIFNKKDEFETTPFLKQRIQQTFKK